MQIYHLGREERVCVLSGKASFWRLRFGDVRFELMTHVSEKKCGLMVGLVLVGI